MYQFQVGSKEFFFINTKCIHKYDVSLNKTVTKLCTLLKKMFFFSISEPYKLPLYLPSETTLISQKVFRNNQVNLENTTNLNSSP